MTSHSPDDDVGVVAGHAQLLAPQEALRVGAQVLGHGENRVRQSWRRRHRRGMRRLLLDVSYCAIWMLFYHFGHCFSYYIYLIDGFD